MSADINVSPPVRQAYTAYRSSVSTPLSASFHSMSPRAPLSPLYPHDTPPMSPSPRLRPLPLGSSPQLTPSHPSASPIITNEELQHLRSLTSPVPVTLPSSRAPLMLDDAAPPDAYTALHPSLDLYLADLFSAARHHPLLDGGLLTRRAHRDAEALVRAHRVVCGDALGAQLVTRVALALAAAAPSLAGSRTASDGPRTEDAHGLSWDEHAHADDAWLGAELRAGARKAGSVRSVEVRIEGPDGECEHERGHSRGHDARSGGGAPFGSRESLPGAFGGSFMSPLPLPPEVWDVSEVDVGRVFPRVVSHRLRVRSGPDDEILGSIMHPAVHQQPSVDAPPIDRKTVKQIVVGILADV